jgi:hypothetical protein
MRSISLFLTTVIVLIAAVLAGAASANPPNHFTFTVTGSSSVPGICSFPITFDGHGEFRGTDFFDSSGTLVGFHGHVKNPGDVISANGISLPGLPYSFNIDLTFAPDGTLTAGKAVGIVEKFRLPDGKLFNMAGYTNLLTLPPGQEQFIFSVTHGNPGDTAALCAALTP